MGCSASRFDTLIEKAFENSLSSPVTSSNTKKNSSLVPKTRSLSTPSVHHPALKKGDTHHVVCLTSTTYGSLFNVEKDGFSLSRASSPDSVVNVRNRECSFVGKDCVSESEMGLGRAQTEKEEKTSPDSVINAWELMQGLEDDENSYGNQFKVKSVSVCDFNDEMLNLVDDDSSDFKAKSFNVCDFNDAQKLPVSKLDMGLIDCSSDFKVKSWNSCDFNDSQKLPNSKLGRNLPDSRFGLNSVDSGGDFKVRSSKSELNLSKSLMKLSDSYVFVEIPSEIIEEDESFEMSPDTKSLWKHLSEELLLSKIDPYVGNPYERALTGQKSVGSSPIVSKTTYISPNSPLVSKLGSEDKIVLYFTSLRSIRKTYEDCSTVRMILKGFRVVVDERDISMDSSFRKELQSALVGKAMSLPQLFIRGKHIGGADDVKLLHETGELESILEGCPTKDCGYVCRVCGDARFVPCSNCYGSRKIFLEEEGQTRNCPECNENGLVRCPDCCS